MKYPFRTKALLSVIMAAFLFSACSSTGAEKPAAVPAPTESKTETPAGDESPDEAPAEKTPVLGEFTATDLDGNEVDQSIFADYSLTMVNIWGTFCGYCLAEMPDLGALHEEYADQGFQVVGIVTDVLNKDGTISEDQVALAKEIVEETKANYLHLLPSEDIILAKLIYVYGLPETFFVDSDGNQVGETYSGALSKEKWAKIIEELLAQVQEAEADVSE